MSEKDLQKSSKQMEHTINEKLSEMGRRLENLEQEFANLQEDSKISRTAVNLLLDWADDSSIQTAPIHRRKQKDETF